MIKFLQHKKETFFFNNYSYPLDDPIDLCNLVIEQIVDGKIWHLFCLLVCFSPQMMKALSTACLPALSFRPIWITIRPISDSHSMLRSKACSTAQKILVGIAHLGHSRQSSIHPCRSEFAELCSHQIDSCKADRSVEDFKAHGLKRFHKQAAWECSRNGQHREVASINGVTTANTNDESAPEDAAILSASDAAASSD